MKLYVAFLLVLISFLGCKKGNNVSENYAYLGGEIINPNTNYIVLSKDENVIDTIKLDGRNRFLYKIKDLQQGLYVFFHGGEKQMVLLEPKDSVLLRLNTLDFDESLVFTGKGDKKNNYLINEYLKNEEEERHVVRLCQLTPDAYTKHIDSLKSIKVDKLQSFKTKHAPSKLFQKIAEANINYNYYSTKEVYPFVHYGRNKAAILKLLPKDFYAYRKDINYNDEFSSSDFSYMAFLRRNFSNIALKVHDEHSDDKRFNRKSLCYNLDRLNLIDSLVENKATKDDLLQYFAAGYLSVNKNEANNDVFLKSFLDKSKNEKHKETLIRYTKSLKKLREGLKLPDVEVINYNNQVIKLSSMVNKPTVITFWSRVFYKHFKDMHDKIDELKLKYPEVKFISINIDDENIETYRKALMSYGYNLTNEYQFKNAPEAKEILAVYPMTKTIILDKNSTIVNSNTNIFSTGFEEQLLGLINR